MKWRAPAWRSFAWAGPEHPANMLSLDQRARTLACLHALGRKDGGYAVEAAQHSSGLQHTVHVWKALRLLGSDVADVPHHPPVRATLLRRVFGWLRRTPRIGAHGPVHRAGSHRAAAGWRTGAVWPNGSSRPPGSWSSRPARPPTISWWWRPTKKQPSLARRPRGRWSISGPLAFPDGTFGESAFANAVCSGAILRARQKLDQPEPIIRRLLRAQSAEGGFADHEGPADLLTTYAAMRALVLLDRTPDLDGLRRYLRGLQRHDGGFGVKSGAPASAAATYQGLAVLGWMAKLGGAGFRASAIATVGDARPAPFARAGHGSRKA